MRTFTYTIALSVSALMACAKPQGGYPSAYPSMNATTWPQNVTVTWDEQCGCHMPITSSSTPVVLPTTTPAEVTTPAAVTTPAEVTTSPTPPPVIRLPPTPSGMPPTASNTTAPSPPIEPAAGLGSSYGVQYGVVVVGLMGGLLLPLL